MLAAPIIPILPAAPIDGPCDTPALPRKRDGSPKRRLSWADKLTLLDPESPVEATEARLDDFLDLFAFRRTRGIVTRVGEAHRSWTELKDVPLDRRHVARHLLADRASPILGPQWAGARSLSTSLLFCLDIDPDRGSSPGKPPFLDRCRHVERSLRRLGIDPSDPRQVLVVPSPSGGRHYYVFFDGPYHLDQYRALFESAGLRHVSSQVEFFPSETQGLRLPFGHMPGLQHDRRAWIQFIDDFKNGRIVLHSLQVLHERLARHLARRGGSRHVPRVELRPATKTVEPATRILGVPKSRRAATVLYRSPRTIDPAEVERYQTLISRGIQTFREADELLELGILLPGTRNAVLNMLAAHLIWFRNDSARRAADFLTRWSMDRRHQSVDIRSDLDLGTSRVATQITAMCAWYESRRQLRPTGERTIVGGATRFAIAEIQFLRTSVLSLPAQDRIPQAHFLLHFLAFAKRHGRVAADGSGREAAAAIQKVVKRWPGCGSKNYYKFRMTRAEDAGVFGVVLEKWQNPHGPGRARTYRLAVPIVEEADWTLGYDAALSLLAGLPERVRPGASTSIEHDAEPREQTDESDSESTGSPRPPPRGRLATCSSAESRPRFGTGFMFMRSTASSA